MKYVSTRGHEAQLTGAQAIIQGLSQDKGLFVPTTMPKLTKSLDELLGKKYKEVATEVLSAFFDDYTAEEIKACVEGAYTDKFEAEDVVPVVKAGDGFFLELYHGRTAAFKDMALSILPYLLTTAVKKEGEKDTICILTATSGDTGKAALEGFADVPGTEIAVFFPTGGVSQVQRQQMVSQEGKNTHVYAIRGNFDDAQTGVKNIFNNDEFGAELKAKAVKLSSANSINIGRLVPQVAYYVYGYLKMVEQGNVKMGETVNVCVPTGNFGNILAAYYAKQLGVPLGKLICASNENKVLTDFFETGVYDTRRDFHLTNSPSMDILVSSNLERLLYHMSGENGEEIKAYMAGLDTEKNYKVSDKIKAAMDENFYAGYTTVAETEDAIGRMYNENNYLMDTHTAVAYKVYEDYRKNTGDTTPTLVASTASAYKFAESVARALGIPEQADGFAAIDALFAKTGVAIPMGLKGLAEKEIRHKDVIDKEEMMDVVRKAVTPRYVISSQNKGKLAEFKGLFAKYGLDVVTRDMAGVPEDYDVVEDGETLEENSYKKAYEIMKMTGEPTLADDSGLMVDALDGAPGVYTARFAGENCTYDDNNNKMLEVLKDVPFEKRTAKFMTVISLVYPDGTVLVARGECPGHIATEKRGDQGFGYDPLFIPEGYETTFAEMGPEIKNTISHRARALAELEKILEGR